MFEFSWRVRRNFWAAVATISILANPQFAQSQEQSPANNDRPNIVVFLVDDLGWQDTSVAFSSEETGFQKHFRTPHVQRLANRGVRFVNAYAHCVCSPTRTSIITGQNPTRHHVTNWTLYPDKDQSGKTTRLAAPANWNVKGIQPAASHLPSLLTSAGYRTIHCGKAHWGAIGTAGSDPENLGFAVNIAGHSAGAPGSYQGSDNFGNHPDGAQKLPWGVPGLEKYHGTETHLSDALAIEASAAIEAAVNDRQNFFLYMAPYAVHTPIQSHPKFIENYQDKNYDGTEIKIPKAEADYASMVEGYDDALGQILATITRLNVADKTIILFTSDNGGLSVHGRGMTFRGTGKNTHCWPLREGKGSAYEGGTRVPMIVSWATTDSGSSLQKQIPIQSGSVSQAHVVSEDIFPTVCRWAGVTLADELAKNMDGQDLTDFATNPAAVNSSRPLLFHYPHVWGPQGDGYQPHSSLRIGEWKVIYFYDQQQWELYNLENDIGETTDLATRNPERLQQMASALIEQLNSHDAQYPTLIESGKPATPQQPE